MDCILGVKPTGNATLFAEVLDRQSAGALVERESEAAADGGVRLSLHQRGGAERKPRAPRVNYLEWWKCDNRKGEQTSFTWVANLRITIENVFEIMCAARA